MIYEKPDMKVYIKKSFRNYKDRVAFMNESGIGKTIVCTGNGGVLVGVSPIPKKAFQKR